MNLIRPIASVFLISTLGGAAGAQDLTPEEVRQSLDAGVRYLKSRQADDGTWPDMSFPGGVTALSVLALLNAGLPLNDPAVARGLDAVERIPLEATYVVSLKTAVLATADPVRYRDDIQKGADWLVRTQLSSGVWSYGAAAGRIAIGDGDNSNTQFALLGLHEASRAGASIPRTVWVKAEKHWLATQCRDGGWNYIGRPPTGTGSMTAAGVASLLICGRQVNEALEQGYRDGAAPRCGKYRQHKAVAAGLNWLADNYTPARNPRLPSWHYYWLYGAERVGMLSGLARFGNHDWYREGAQYLVNNQDSAVGGLLGGGSWNRTIVDTAFAVLFLAKGRRPLLVNKLKWSVNDDWAPDRHDCENLVAWLGDKLGERVSWQVVELSAPIEEWLSAPILYVTGHTFPRFDERTRGKLRRFVEAGGTLFVESCCSRPAFREGFTRFVETVFPEQKLRELAADHPVWKSLFQLKPGEWPLLGVDTGCRTSIIFSPRDLSCLWEQADVPQLSRAAFELGANIAAYATGREPLRDKLDRVVVPAGQAPPPDWTPPRGALQFAQLSHSGDWKPDPWALPKLAEHLHRNAKVDVVAQPRYLRIDDDRLLDHPVAYMTGHFAFELTATEVDGLRRYLKRGGFLFADACCGRAAFAQAFTRMADRLFDGVRLEPLPADHGLFRGRPGHVIERVEYRPAVRFEEPGLVTPALLGLEVDGRLAIVFSPYGLGCGLEDHQCYNCRGVVPADARKLATNIALHALSH